MEESQYCPVEHEALQFEGAAPVRSDPVWQERHSESEEPEQVAQSA